MANPYAPPESNSPGPDSERAQPATARPRKNAGWYLLLLPMSLLYTVAAREFAGPGYTTAPNQGAMVVFLLASVAWPMIAVVVAAIIRRVANLHGIAATSLGLVSWILSSALPFLIGMK